MPRPNNLTPATAALIIERIAGGESLRRICRDEGMPCREAVRLALRDDADFRAKYAAARSDQADELFDEMLEIAHDASITWQERRLQIETRRWMAAKLAPKKYGDRVEVTGDPDLPITQEKSPLELARMVAFALAKAKAEMDRQTLDDPAA